MRGEAMDSTAPQVSWPSGQGTEYGIVDATLPMLAEATNRPIHEDEGIWAIVLDDDPAEPVTFICEPAIAGQTVAVIADARADTDRLHDRIESIIGHIVRWHPVPGAG
jgi:hypothetical protein